MIALVSLLANPTCHRMRGRFDHVAKTDLTDLTHFRIFPRNLAPDFTHYLV
jgi:hypothetical protein